MDFFQIRRIITDVHQGLNLMLDADLVKKTPLLVHLVFHPESASARALAKYIHAALSECIWMFCWNYQVPWHK